MPPPLLVDFSCLDLGLTLLDQDQIYQVLPHGGNFRLLDGVCHEDQDSGVLVAFHDVRLDQWYFRGHFPGRPLLPGIAMVEMAAQAAALQALRARADGTFVGFGGIDKCRFREAVSKPTRLYLLCRAVDLRSRRIVSETQGVSEGRLIFEATITGLSMARVVGPGGSVGRTER